MLRGRREFLALLAGAYASPALAQIPPPAVRAQASSPEMSRPTAYAFAFKRLEGGDLRLAEHAGKPILVVNTASLCGFTPQYDGLQQLWTRFREQGLLIVGCRRMISAARNLAMRQKSITWRISNMASAFPSRKKWR